MEQPDHHIKRTTTREIKQLCQKIAREFRPQKVILFGSHAYGKPEWDSDVDLLVIMPFKGRPTRQAATIRSSIDAPFAMDLLVRTPQEVEKRVQMGDSFMREIMERGKIIYEAHHDEDRPRDGSRGFLSSRSLKTISTTKTPRHQGEGSLRLKENRT